MSRIDTYNKLLENGSMNKFNVGDKVKYIFTNEICIIEKVCFNETNNKYYYYTSMSNCLRFAEDFLELIESKKSRGFEIVTDEFRKHKDVDIQLPKRGSSKSAGYDISTPIKIIIPPFGITDAIQTDIKAYMRDDEVLMLAPRSSIGFKKGLMLINTIGVIDSDYYSNKDNDGNIGFKFKNLTDKEVVIEAGERIIQGIFIKYYTTDNDYCDKERVGGIGSTGK